MADLDDYGAFDGQAKFEDFWRDFFRHLTGTGVIDGVGGEFEVAERGAGANMSVDVASGECFIRGQWGESTGTKNVAIAEADPANPRIDRVVLRNDFGENKISIEVLEGAPAAVPAAPALTQSAAMWEISLAQVAVPALDASIADAQITDERTVIGFPMFDYSAAPADGDGFAYDAATGLFVPQADSGLTFERSNVAADQATSSTTLTSLATAQSVTLTTGANVIIGYAAEFYASGTVAGIMNFEVSGATTRAAQAGEKSQALANANGGMLGRTLAITGLTPGVNTFTLKFAASTAVAVNFANRTFFVLDLGG